MNSTDRTATHFHAGHSDAGYMPESDVETFDTFADAKSYMIQELLWAADNIASWADEHDCDDVPCPTYGDDCPEQLASAAALEAESLNLESGPAWQAYLSDGRSLPVSWWIEPCQEAGCVEDYEDDTSLRQTASDWHGGQASALYAFSSTGSIVPGLEAEIRNCLRELVAGQYRSDAINVETPRLSALLDYVVSQTPELPAEHTTNGEWCQCPDCDASTANTVHELQAWDSPSSGLYGVTVQVEHTRDGWHGSYGLPYFQVQACSEADAVKVARTIVEAQTVGARPGETRTLHIVAVAL